MAANTVVHYQLLYRNLIQATNMLYTNKISNTFVKEEIRREFRARREFKNPKLVRNHFNYGHEVLQTMVSLIENKPELIN